MLYFKHSHGVPTNSSPGKAGYKSYQLSEPIEITPFSPEVVYLPKDT